jgi:hypothetical protein
MHLKWLVCLVLLVVVGNSQEPEIIDFTYTQLLQEATYSIRPRDEIVITPDTQQLEKYQFPEVCHLLELLKEGTDSSGTLDHSTEAEDYLDRLRDRILHLLVLAEEIKNARSYLAGTLAPTQRSTNTWIWRTKSHLSNDSKINCRR